LSLVTATALTINHAKELRFTKNFIPSICNSLNYQSCQSGKTSIVEADGTAYTNAEPGKGAKQLKAVDHYGLKSFRQIKEKSRLPVPTRINKDAFETWWHENAQGREIRQKDFAGLPITFTEKFKKHLLKDENHYAVTGDLFSTIKNPDEVWETIKHGSHRRDWFSAYLKFCDPNPLVLLVDEDNKPVTFYEMKISQHDSFRTGVLIKKK